MLDKIKGFLSGVKDKVVSGVKNVLSSPKEIAEIVTSPINAAVNIGARVVRNNIGTGLNIAGKAFDFLTEPSDTSIIRDFGEGGLLRARGEDLARQQKENDEFINSLFNDDPFDSFSTGKNIFKLGDKSSGEAIVSGISDLFLESRNMAGAFGTLAGERLRDEFDNVSRNRRSFGQLVEEERKDTDIIRNADIFGYTPLKLDDPGEFVRNERAMQAFSALTTFSPQGAIRGVGNAGVRKSGGVILNGLDDVTGATVKAATAGAERVGQFAKGAGRELSQTQQIYVADRLTDEFSGLVDDAEAFQSSDLFNSAVARLTKETPDDATIIANIITDENAAKRGIDKAVSEFVDSPEFELFESEQQAFIKNADVQEDLLQVFNSERVLSYGDTDVPSLYVFTRSDGTLDIGKRIPKDAKESSSLAELARKAGEKPEDFFNRYKNTAQRASNLSPKKRMYERLMERPEFKSLVRSRQLNSMTSSRLSKLYGGRLAFEVQKVKALRKIEKAKLRKTAAKNLDAAKERLVATKAKARFDKNMSKAELFVQRNRAAKIAAEKAMVKGMGVGESVGKRLGAKKVLDRVADLQSYKMLFPGDRNAQEIINTVIGRALSDKGRNLQDPFFANVLKHLDMTVENIIDRNIRTDTLVAYEEATGRVISNVTEKILDKSIKDFTNKELDELLVAYERVLHDGEELLPREVIYALSKGKNGLKIPDIAITDVQRLQRLEKALNENKNIMSAEFFESLFLSKDVKANAKNFIKSFKTGRGKTASGSFYQSPIKAALSFAAQEGRIIAFVKKNAVQDVNRVLYKKARAKAIKSGFATKGQFVKQALETGDPVKTSIKNYLLANASRKVEIEAEWINYGIEKEMMATAKHLEGIYDAYRQTLKASNLQDKFKQNYSHAVVDETLSSVSKSIKRGEYLDAAKTAIRGQQSGMSAVYADEALKDGFAGFTLDKKSFQYEANFDKFLDYSDDPFTAIERYTEEAEMLLHANKYNDLMTNIYAAARQLEVDMRKAGMNPKVVASTYESLENFFRFNVEGASLEKTFGRFTSQDSLVYSSLNALMRTISFLNFFASPQAAVTTYTGEILGTSLPRILASKVRAPIQSAKYFAGHRNLKNALSIERSIDDASVKAITDEITRVTTLGKSDVLDSISRGNFKPDVVGELGYLPLRLGVAKSQAAIVRAQILDTHTELVSKIAKMIKGGKKKTEIFTDPEVVAEIAKLKVATSQMVDKFSAVRSAAGEEILTKASTMYMTWALQVINGTFQAAKFQATKMTSKQWEKNLALYKDVNRISRDTAIWGLTGITTTGAASVYISNYAEDIDPRLGRILSGITSNSYGIHSNINSFINNRVGKTAIEATSDQFVLPAFVLRTWKTVADGAFSVREGASLPSAIDAVANKVIADNVGALRLARMVKKKKTVKQYDLEESADMVYARAKELSAKLKNGELSQEEYSKQLSDSLSAVASSKKYTEDDKELTDTYVRLKIAGEKLEDYPQVYGNQDFSSSGVAYANYKALASVTDPEERERRKGIVEKIVLRDKDKSKGNKNLEKFQSLYNFATNPAYSTKKDREKLDNLMAVYNKNRSIKREKIVEFVTYDLDGADKKVVNQRVQGRMAFIMSFIEPNDEESAYIDELLNTTLKDMGHTMKKE